MVALIRHNHEKFNKTQKNKYSYSFERKLHTEYSCSHGLSQFFVVLVYFASKIQVPCHFLLHMRSLLLASTVQCYLFEFIFSERRVRFRARFARFLSWIVIVILI